MNLGLFQAATDSAEAFAKLPGAEARGHLLLATLHTELENIPRAAEELEKVLALEPDARNLRVSPAEVFSTYGTTLLRLGRSAEAIPPLTRSLELVRLADTYVAIGRAHTELGDTEQADRALRQALTVDPAHKDAREMLAIAAFDDDDSQKALEWLTPLVRDVDPAAAQYGASGVSSSTAFLLQQAYARIGNEPEAVKWQAHAEKVRKSESLIQIVQDVLRVAPASIWGRAIRAHHAVFSGDWPSADELVRVITPEDRTAHVFLDKLMRAVTARDESLLPGFDELPIDLYD